MKCFVSRRRNTAVFFLLQEILTLPIMHTYIEFYGTRHEDALRQALAFLWCFLTFPIPDLYSCGVFEK